MANSDQATIDNVSSYYNSSIDQNHRNTHQIRSEPFLNPDFSIKQQEEEFQSLGLSNYIDPSNFRAQQLLLPHHQAHPQQQSQQLYSQYSGIPNLNYLPYQLSNNKNSFNQATINSGRSSLSDANSSSSDPQLQLPRNRAIPNMNHRRTISISSEQSAIETSNLQDPNTATFNLGNNGSRNDRKVSITDSDRNVSPVLQSDPFELDQSLWASAAQAPVSTPSGSTGPSAAQDSGNTITDLNSSPGYRYRADSSNNTSPTFTSGFSNRPSLPFNEFNLNAIQQPPAPADSNAGAFHSRSASIFSDTVWNRDHSRQSSFNNMDGTSPAYSYPKSNDKSPVWSQFKVGDWKSKPLPPQQQQQQQMQFRNPYFNPSDEYSNTANASAAQRRHSYAAVGDNQWANEYFGFGTDTGYFNYAQPPPPPQQPQSAAAAQQQQSQHFGSSGGYGHIQRLSADFGNLGLDGTASPSADNNDYKQPQESSAAFRNTYKAFDYYFTFDEHHRVHITDASTADLPATLDALCKKGAQLPRFPGNTLPGAKLVLVAFKAGRVDVFYLPENNKMILNVGDLVLVEADRGQDLGKIVRLDISIDEARLLKLRQHQEQQAALVDNEQLVSSGFLPAVNTSGGGSAAQQAQQAQQQAATSLHFPKPVIKFAEPQQVAQVPNKAADEEKACRVCALKVRTHGLVMQVVDAEYQWDRRKLTFYYAANQRIDFRELVKELFRIYKTRIWMCAVSGGLTALQQQQEQEAAAVASREFGSFTGVSAAPAQAQAQNEQPNRHVSISGPFNDRSNTNNHSDKNGNFNDANEFNKNNDRE